MSLMNQNKIFLEISSHFSVCRPNSLHYHLQIHFIQHLQTEHIVLYSVYTRWRHVNCDIATNESVCLYSVC